MSDQSMSFSGPPPCPNGFLYTIQPGDTYFLLAQRFGTTVAAIQAANPGVDPNNLQIGQVICIPVAARHTSCRMVSCTIQPGDPISCWRSAGTTVAEVQAANQWINNLQIGRLFAFLCGAATMLASPIPYSRAHLFLAGAAPGPVAAIRRPPERIPTCSWPGHLHSRCRRNVEQLPVYHTAGRHLFPAGAALRDHGGAIRRQPGVDPNNLQIQGHLSF